MSFLTSNGALWEQIPKVSCIQKHLHNFLRDSSLGSLQFPWCPKSFFSPQQTFPPSPPALVTTNSFSLNLWVSEGPPFCEGHISPPSSLLGKNQWHLADSLPLSPCLIYKKPSTNSVAPSGERPSTALQPSSFSALPSLASLAMAPLTSPWLPKLKGYRLTGIRQWMASGGRETLPFFMHGGEGWQTLTTLSKKLFSSIFSPSSSISTLSSWAGGIGQEPPVDFRNLLWKLCKSSPLWKIWT